MKAFQSIRFYALVVFVQMFFAVCVLSRARAQTTTDTVQAPIVITTPPFIQRLDDNIMLSLALSRTPRETKIMRWFSDTHLYFNIGVPAGMFAGGLIANNQQLRQNALFVASSTAFAFLSTSLIKRLVKRRRPFVQNIKIIPVYRPDHYSFPSGHTSAAFATASALSAAYPKWYVIIPSYLWAGSVGYSRMYLGVHYTTDVATGAALGGVSTLATWPLKK